jgi:hypothetical protein
MVEFATHWKVSSADRTATSPVLAVDLDGTLLKTDLLLESLLALLIHSRT